MTAELVAEEGVLKGLILSLEKGEEWTIGRDPDVSSIAIEDLEVSRLHMLVSKQTEGYYVENISKTKPLFVNEIEITKPTLLHERDLLKVGGSIFRFYPEGLPADIAYEMGPEEEDEFTEDIQTQTEQPQSEDHDSEEDHFLEDAYFEEPQHADSQIDLTLTTRFFIKVISGPNTGAEFALDLDRSYLIGTDTSICDIIFNDLSVSREHARLNVSKDGDVQIQDLNSRNGIIVDKERIFDKKDLEANSVVALGTSSFLLIDRQAPSETIMTPVYESEEMTKEEISPLHPPPAEEPMIEPVAPRKKTPAPIGGFLMALGIACLAILLGIALVSLLKTQEVAIQQKDKAAELYAILKNYPAVRYTYNPNSEMLFLMGDVKTGIEHNELLYQLKGLNFLQGIDDNIVNDEAVWQEMNILLSKHPDFKGISMHSPEAGVFVINGYLQTMEQASKLTDYLNINFNYLNKLQNKVVVEEAVRDEVMSQLKKQGFEAIDVSFVNGALILKGYISSSNGFAYNKLVNEIEKIPGVRTVNDLVVAVTPEQEVIDLNIRYLTQNANITTKEKKTLASTLRYRVTGYSTQGDTNVNVVINGRILSRGDCIDGYTITSIQPHTIFLEKDGLKYKIDYNKCSSLGVEE